MKRPDRQNYPNGVFGDISYNDRLERYCSYLENQNKQLRIGAVSQQRELLLAYAEYHNDNFEYEKIYDVMIDDYLNSQ